MRSVRMNLQFMFSVAAVLIVVCLGAAVWVVWASTTKVLDAHHETESLNRDAAAAREILSSLVVQQALQAEYAITVDPQLMVVFEETAETAFGRLDEIAERRVDDPDVTRVAAEVRELDVAHDAIIFDEMVPAFERGDTEAGNAALADAQVTLDGLLGNAQELVDIFDARAADSAARVGTETGTVRVTTIVAGVVIIVLVLSGLIGLYAALRARFRHTLTALHGVQQQVATSDKVVRDHVEGTSNEVDRIVLACDDATEEINEISGSIEELSASIAEISAASSQAASVANEAVARAEQTTETVSELGASSAEIGQVVEVITSIAKQTEPAGAQRHDRGGPRR